MKNWVAKGVASEVNFIAYHLMTPDVVNKFSYIELLKNTDRREKCSTSFLFLEMVTSECNLQINVDKLFSKSYSFEANTM